MGSCLSSGYHGKKKLAPAASVTISVPAVSRTKELRREDNLQDLTTRSSSLGEDRRSPPHPAVEVLPQQQQQQQQQQPVVDLDPAIWSQLPDDITRLVIGKLPGSSLMHLQCVSKQWNTWINESYAANEINRQVHPIFIFMYTLILVKDLDDPETREELCERSTLDRPLARYFRG